jgi:hypothetical protein
MRNQQGKNESLLQLRVCSGLGLRLLVLYLSVALSPTIYAQQTFGPAAVESDLPNSPGSELPSPQSATASLAQDMFASDRYGPGNAPNPPLPSVRYSDSQLYALALYIYSLRPPANPNHFDASAARGKVLFINHKCDACHTPPLYTNNKLVPVDGFELSHAEADAIPVRIGVDPRYTLETHKGTGYYKIPSLKAFGIEAPSAITVRPRLLKTGLTQPVSDQHMFLQVSKGMMEKLVQFRAICLGSTYPQPRGKT